MEFPFLQAKSNGFFVFGTKNKDFDFLSIFQFLVFYFIFFYDAGHYYNNHVVASMVDFNFVFSPKLICSH